MLEIIEDCVARGEFDLVKEGIIKNLSKYAVMGFAFDGYIASIKLHPVLLPG